LVGETVFVTVTVPEKELVALVVMVPVKDGDTGTPDNDVLDETTDARETEELVEIPEATVAVILTAAAPAEAVPEKDATVEGASEAVAEIETEHIRRTRKLAKSETTTEATPDGFWVAATTSTSEGFSAF